MNTNDKLELAKTAMRYKIHQASDQLPDISDASKEQMMQLILGTAYMMMVELLESPTQSWSTAARAQSAFILKELGKDCMRGFYERPHQ
jgi:hypothetical protein